MVDFRQAATSASKKVEIGEPESVTAMPGHIAGAAPSETAVVEARTEPDVEV